MAQDRTFEIGFVMAGAISAGAFTAGVMDFIFEALDAYEEEKSKQGWRGPRHDVRVPVFAGASAGGMTSAISALHAFRELEHVQPAAAAPRPQRNRLYSSWVTDISIERLLETADLAGKRRAQGATSALCSDVLDEIVLNAFDIDGPLKKRNWVGRGNNHLLRVFLTLTNLRGVPYSFKLFGAEANERYGMLNHADYYEFSVGPSSDWLDSAMPLDASDLKSANWATFRTSALATGAFPVGLRPRPIQRQSAGWYRNAGCVGYEDWRQDPSCFVPIGPDDSFGDEAPYQFVAVDGGTINNEPLELARRYLAGSAGHNPQDGARADKAVVLVAPFPNYRAAPKRDDAIGLVHVFRQLRGALQDQARLKPDELALAANDDVFSRFMISPIRTGNGSDAAQRLPIASGSMNGFGGFLHQSFRRHDYLLGRRNAQAFLQWNFALPKSNEKFLGLDIDDRRWLVRNADREQGSITLERNLELEPKQFAVAVGSERREPGYPIIPLVDRLCTPIEIGPADMPDPTPLCCRDLKKRVGERAQAVVDTLVDVDFQKEVATAKFLAPVLTFGARRFGKMIAEQRGYKYIEDAVNDVRDAFADRA